MDLQTQKKTFVLTNYQFSEVVNGLIYRQAPGVIAPYAQANIKSTTSEVMLQKREERK